MLRTVGARLQPGQHAHAVAVPGPPARRQDRYRTSLGDTVHLRYWPPLARRRLGRGGLLRDRPRGPRRGTSVPMRGGT